MTDKNSKAKSPFQHKGGGSAVTLLVAKVGGVKLVTAAAAVSRCLTFVIVIRLSILVLRTIILTLHLFTDTVLWVKV